MGEVSAYLLQLTIDWNGEPQSDESETRVPVSCGELREAAARIEALEEALRPLAEDARLWDEGLTNELDSKDVGVCLGDLRRARAVLEDERDG